MVSLGIELRRLTYQRKLLLRIYPDDPQIKAVKYGPEHQCLAKPSRVPDLLHGYEDPTDQHTAGRENPTSSEKTFQCQYPSVPIATNASLPPTTADLEATTEIAAHEEPEPADSRLAQFLQSYSEPFGIQSQRMWSYDASLGSLCCWFGPMIFKRWTERNEELFDLRPEKSAYGLRLTVRSSNLYLRTLCLEVCVQTEIHRLEIRSIRFSLSFTKTISKDSSVIRLASVGDVKSVKELFEERRAGPTDTTPNGTSLLHVRQLQHGCTRSFTDVI